MIRTIACLVLLLIPAPARADERHAWSVGPDLGWVFLGPRERLTGGLAVGAHGARSWRLGENTAFQYGVFGTAIGVGGEGHWLGVLAGPMVDVERRVVAGLKVGIAADAPYGRLSVCNDWGVPMRYWTKFFGAFPGGSLRVSYGSESTSVALGVRARYVSTLSWTGWSWEPTAAARFAF
jgi:hypothetical protein